MGAAACGCPADQGRVAVPTARRGGDGMSRLGEGRPEIPEPLPHPVVDNHCHLDIDPVADADWSPRELIDTATSVGVARIVQIGCDPSGARWAAQAALD